MNTRKTIFEIISVIVACVVALFIGVVGDAVLDKATYVRPVDLATAYGAYPIIGALVTYFVSYGVLDSFFGD